MERHLFAVALTGSNRGSNSPVVFVIVGVIMVIALIGLYFKNRK